MNKYIEFIVSEINKVTTNCGQILLFGENIDKGSCLSGLSRGLKVNSNGQIINIGNCELTHFGIGLGIMLDGGNSVLFAKQMDFILLGLEQACSTFNFIRAFKSKSELGSFTIVCIVCDQGFQGPQSSSNNASDISSLANIPIYCINFKDDITKVISNNLVAKGFRIIFVSQRAFNSQINKIPLIHGESDCSIFKYSEGKDVTLASYNFALPETLKIYNYLKSNGFESDLYHINYVPNHSLEPILSSLKKTGKLVVIDDSKSIKKYGDYLASKILQKGIKCEYIEQVRRGSEDKDYGVCHDQMIFDYKKILKFVSNRIS